MIKSLKSMGVQLRGNILMMLLIIYHLEPWLKILFFVFMGGYLPISRQSIKCGQSIGKWKSLMMVISFNIIGSFCDLMWSDPENIEAWAPNNRGAGWIFGNKVVRDFNHINGLHLIARAHQLVQ